MNVLDQEMAVCRSCMRVYKDIASLRSHGYNSKHPLPVKDWMAKLSDFPVGTVFKMGKGGYGKAKTYAIGPNRKLVEAMVFNTPVAPRAALENVIEKKTRTIPPKEEWRQAEPLVNLPWVKYPSTPAIANEMAALCGKMASAVSNKSEEHAILLSQRDFYHAMAKRMAQQAAA